MPTFDIAAKIVTADQKAWVVHAGRAQRDFSDFAQGNIVYLEAPYLRLDNQILKRRGSIRQALRRAEAWLEHQQTFGSSAPSEELDLYDDNVFEDARLTTLSGSVSRLYGQARPGDIVVTPGRNEVDGFWTPIVMFGEIVGEFNPDAVHNGTRAGTQQVPFRNVRWLSKVPRKAISIHLENKIGRPPAVRQIAIEKETEELLRHAYKSYIFQDSSSSLITGGRYDGEDFVTLNRSSDLIAALVAAYAVFGVQNPEKLEIGDLASFTRDHFDMSPIENIEVDFASPGHWRILGATSGLAAFVGLGIAVFTSGLSIDDLLQGINVVNSVSQAAEQEDALERSMNFLLNSLDRLELQKTLDVANTAKERIGLESSVEMIP